MKPTNIFTLRHLPKLGLLLAILLLSSQTTGSSLAQSFPTFTPTPGPATNTPVPQPTNTSPPSPPTNTPSAQQPTHTPTPPAATVAPVQTTVAGTASPTPLTSRPLSTAQPCSPDPTLQTLITVNVRQGPGTAYPLLIRLAAGEVLPLVGHAAEATWWVVEIENGSMGWVLDSATAVSIQGYIGLLPIIEAPLLGSNTPTPGPTWQPTPNPNCAVTPTATRQTTMPTATVTATPIGAATRDTTTLAETESEAEQAVPPTPETADTDPTPAPLATDPPGTNNWLPIVGITLILAGVVAAILMRRW
jgi:hypothetical protein